MLNSNTVEKVYMHYFLSHHKSPIIIGRQYYFHFIDEETEVQSSYLIILLNQQLVEPEFQASLISPQSPPLWVAVWHSNMNNGFK